MLSENSYVNISGYFFFGQRSSIIFAGGILANILGKNVSYRIKLVCEY